MPTNPHAHHRDKLLASWDRVIELLHELKNYPPGSVHRDDQLARYFKKVQTFMNEVGPVCTIDPELPYDHLQHAILSGANNLVVYIRNDFDDDAKIHQLIDKYSPGVRQTIERLHRDNVD